MGQALLRENNICSLLMTSNYSVYLIFFFNTQIEQCKQSPDAPHLSGIFHLFILVLLCFFFVLCLQISIELW